MLKPKQQNRQKSAKQIKHETIIQGTIRECAIIQMARENWTIPRQDLYNRKDKNTKKIFMRLCQRTFGRGRIRYNLRRQMEHFQKPKICLQKIVCKISFS